MNDKITSSFEFTGFHGCKAICGLEPPIVNDLGIVIIVTEIEENRGTSITNAVEILLPQVCDNFNIDVNEVIWIEHYPPSWMGNSEEQFDLVTLVKNDAGVFDSVYTQWKRLTANEVELIKEGVNPFDPEKIFAVRSEF